MIRVEAFLMVACVLLAGALLAVLALSLFYRWSV
jgi:hypothetical protein